MSQTEWHFEARYWLCSKRCMYRRLSLAEIGASAFVLNHEQTVVPNRTNASFVFDHELSTVRHLLFAKWVFEALRRISAPPSKSGGRFLKLRYSRAFPPHSTPVPWNSKSVRAIFLARRQRVVSLVAGRRSVSGRGRAFPFGCSRAWWRDFSPQRGLASVPLGLRPSLSSQQ